MHRFPVPGPLYRGPDPADSADPQIRELVAELAQLRIAPDPDPRFRTELRAQLVAVAPRLVEDGRAKPVASGARHTDDRLARHPIRWRRPLAAAASVLVVLGLLLGGAVWMSRGALPGDALYGLKRTSERVQLFFASSDTDRAKDYLQFAQRRADEVKKLLHRDSASALGVRPTAAGINAETTKLISQTLSSADSDTQTAMRLLGGQVARKKSAQPLDPMKDWAPPQLKRLQSIAKSAPTTAVRKRVDLSVGVLVRVWTRTLALNRTAACACTGTAGSDALGPRPCLSCAVPGTPGPGTRSPGATGPAAPTGATTTRRQGATGGAVRSGTGGATGGASASSSAGGGGPGGGAPSSSPPSSARRSTGAGGPATPTPSSSAQPGLPLPLPSLSLPVADLNSCHVAIDAGPLHIAITVCPSPSGG
jgi:uncharacterized membrane protein YgcG